MRKSRVTFARFFSLMLAFSMVFVSFAGSAWAADSEPEPLDKKQFLDEEVKEKYEEENPEGIGLHADPATFEKNLDLSRDQKEQTITYMDQVVSEIIKPEMSDLEKYYTLAVWLNEHVNYDWEFWMGSYNFDYYSHQWDSYGVMIEQNAVCVGIAICYSHLCHAAGLPCRFVRIDPKQLDHTISYIPDINGNAYYIDVTENMFFMSEKANPFNPVDKDFAYITKDCTDDTFNYRPGNSDELQPGSIRECWENKISYKDWFNEFALHENTTRKFPTKYVEKGSGLPATDSGSRHASYSAFRSNFVEHPDVWFLDDFFRDPAAIKSKILNKEFDEQLLNVSGVKKSYDCESAEDLEAKVKNDIAVSYFPSSENGEVVAKAAGLSNGTDYEVTLKNYDEAAKTAEFTVNGIGEYKGSHQIQVRLNSAVVDKAPAPVKHLVYNGKKQTLIEPGEAAGGEMLYALVTDTKTPGEGEFTAEIPAATDAGKYYIWYKAVGDAAHGETEPQCLDKPVTIAAIPTTIIAEDMIKLEVGKTATISPKLDVDLPVEFSFVSLDEDIATVTKDGVVKGIKSGTAPIYVMADIGSGTNYEKPYDLYITVRVKADGESDFALSKSAFTYNGKVRKPTIMSFDGMELAEGIDYTAKWSNKSSKNVGKYTVTITGMGDYEGSSDKLTYKINPKGTSLKDLRKARKAIKVRWKKQSSKMSKSRITGYQIRLATNKRFTKNMKTVTVKGYKTVSKKITKLKGGMKYYVKIRTYKTINGKNYYSPWSRYKSVRTGR